MHQTGKGFGKSATKSLFMSASYLQELFFAILALKRFAIS
jgi:hypothetical protein